MHNVNDGDVICGKAGLGTRNTNHVFLKRNGSREDNKRNLP